MSKSKKRRHSSHSEEKDDEDEELWNTLKHLKKKLKKRRKRRNRGKSNKFHSLSDSEEIEQRDNSDQSSQGIDEILELPPEPRSPHSGNIPSQPTENERDNSQNAQTTLNIDQNDPQSSTSDKVVLVAESLPQEEESLQKELLEVLGDRLESDIIFATAINKDIAVRWMEIIRKGLPKEAIESNIKKYTPPENCKDSLPPKLNPEMKASIPETSKKRDDRIYEKQRKITACLGALGRSLSIVVKTDCLDKVVLFEHLNNLGKLLSDLQHGESSVRKTLIQSNLNESFKDTLNEAVTDDWLYGKDLGEKLKSAKSLKLSSKDLKPPPKPQPGKTTKNGRGPPRRDQTRSFQPMSNAQKPTTRSSSDQAGHSFKKNFPQRGKPYPKRRF